MSGNTGFEKWVKNTLIALFLAVLHLLTGSNFFCNMQYDHNSYSIATFWLPVAMFCIKLKLMRLPERMCYENITDE
jgi:uncharacterized membrane protein